MLERGSSVEIITVAGGRDTGECSAGPPDRNIRSTYLLATRQTR